MNKLATDIMTLFKNFHIDNELKDSLKNSERFPEGVNIPTYNIFKDEQSIQIEERAYVNDNLVPVVEYKITVNKESLQRHQMEWKQLFKIHYEQTLANPSNWGSILLDLYTREGILENFKNYLLSPIYKLKSEAIDSYHNKLNE